MRIDTLFAGLPEGALDFRIVKRPVGGKERVIAEPSEALYTLHQRLIRHIENWKIAMPNAMGGVVGSSAVRNAMKHQGNKYFYVLDLKDAFPSVSPERMAEVFQSLEPEGSTTEELVDFLERCCFTEEYGLAQGGPASPILFNLFVEAEVDQRVRDLLLMSQREDIIYTRYIDDLVFSAPSVPLSRSLRREIRNIIECAGFTINERKARGMDICNHEVEITGICLFEGGRMAPSKSFCDSFERELDTWLYAGDDSVKLASLKGKIGHFLHLAKESFHGLNRAQRNLMRKIGQFESAHIRGDVVDRGKRFSDMWLYELVNAIPLASYVGRFVKLKQRSRLGEAKGLCPFHSEKTPSFTVAGEKYFYHCFGCGAHGNVITFAIKINKVSFVTAVEMLATEAGIALPPDYRKKKPAGAENDLPYQTG